MPSMLRILSVLFALIAMQAQAEDRIALVVGNSSYGSVTQLDNPSRDAALIGETLENLGFKVTLLIDATQIDLKRGIGQFGRALREAGPDATGLFYYAGHGVQSFGTNYLLPVDASLSDAADLSLVAVEAESVLRQMFSARNRTNIVVLDACRNNPFENIPAFNDNGLAEMNAPTGTFLAYATAPGAVALDGLDDNSPFTQSLAAKMQMPGVPIEQMFKQVRVDVLEQTRGLQTPWDTSSLTSDFVFAAAEPISAEDLAEQQLWNSVQATRDPVQVMLFLRAYPNSSFEPAARALLSEVMEAELSGGTTAPAAPAPVAQGPSEREKQMFEAAQTAASIAGFEAYLQEFPQGVFSEFAQNEIAALRDDASKDPVGEGVTPAPEPAPKVVQAAPEPQGAVTFNSPLTIGTEAVIGKSIASLVEGAPLFPPIEGLPEEFWKDKSCSTCHEWTRDRLCEQANVYLSLNAQRSLDKQHPYGGSLKQNLKAWAAGDCQ